MTNAATHRSNGAGEADGGADVASLPPDELDDERDRDELRRRYGMLMQELRTLLPGTQVLMAFLLTVPFSQRFAELDDRPRLVFGVAMVATVLAVVAFLSPIAVHRFGDRRERSVRLRQAITMMRVGLVLLAVALLSGVAVVAEVVFGATTAAWLTAVAAASMVAVWVLVPLRTRAGGRAGDERRGEGRAHDG